MSSSLKTNHANDVQHWNEVYSDGHIPIEASSFAHFCSARFKKRELCSGSILEFGCGNGRDALFFARLGFKVVAGDISSTSIARLRSEHHITPPALVGRGGIARPCGTTNNHQPQSGKPLFFCGDFTNLAASDEGVLFAAENGPFACLYSRFTLHSISKKGASDLLKWATQNISPGGLIAIEARSVSDPLYGVGEPVPGEADAFMGVTTHAKPHYRRFIRMNELLSELVSLGWTIQYTCEASDLSRYKDDNPVLVRVIAQLHHPCE